MVLLFNPKQILSESIDLIHKPHNAPVPYPTMHHFITEMCTIYPEAIINMQVWYMYDVWISTMFSLWNCI